jgi:ferredoxin
VQSDFLASYPFTLGSAANAALQVATEMPAADPVPAVSYVSHGRLLIIGQTQLALPWARLLRDTLQVELLVPHADDTVSSGLTLHVGATCSLNGWLGAFEADWGAGIHAYDLVLDLSSEPLFKMHHPPQGYFRVADDAMSAAHVAKELVQATGEFEKPKYFAYEQKLCAHSRSRQQGCSKCLDVCSTQAISSIGDKITVEPHLCMGCGACASVCPSGAMRYNYPSVAYLGARLGAMLAAYANINASRPALLIHSENAQAEWQAREQVSGLLPFEVFRVPAIGLDFLLYAIAAGAGRVIVTTAADEAPQYLAAMREQMALGEAILHGLGYHGTHFLLAEANGLPMLLAELETIPQAFIPAQIAAFQPFNEKRTTLEFCIDYFVKHTPAAVPPAFALPANAPFGNVLVDQAACTLCMSCVSACPAAALRDTPGQPMLRFVERNCVQCGLCETTCPENAISLEPRLLLSKEAAQPRTLHEDAPFHCVSCNKIFGTTRMVANMTAKLAGHSMFATPDAKRRLQMCGDCRVVDMMSEPKVSQHG